MPTFTNWLDTFIEEKGIDTEQVFIKPGKPGAFWDTHVIEFGALVEAMKSTHPDEQSILKDTMVSIDVVNGDVMQYFDYLAAQLALNYEN